MRIIVDPIGKYSDHVKDYKGLIDALGMIPHWLGNNPYLSAKEVFKNEYICGWKPFDGFTMGENGILLYPGDPDLYPYVKYVREEHDEVVYQYPYSWIAIAFDDNFEVARLD